MEKKTVKNHIINYLKCDLWAELAAAGMFGLGIVIFSAPNHFVVGGLTGILTILNYLFGLPIGAMNFVFNIPLLILGYRRIGRGFILRTLRVVTWISIGTDLVTHLNLPPYQGERLLAALFAGVLVGGGMGLVLMRGSSTGGSDIVVKLIKLGYPHLSLGTIILIIDVVIILFAAFVYRDIESLMVSLVMTYVMTMVIDKMIAGAEAKRLVLIVTPHHRRLAGAIIADMDRGATLLDATGAYTGKETGVVVCVVDNQQFYELKRIIMEVDPRAFIIVAHATEIIGEGFKKIEGD